MKIKKKSLVILLIILIVGIPIGIGVYKSISSKGIQAGYEKDVYYCPMHPTFTSDKSGNCPICGMTLVKREKGEHKGHAEMGVAKEMEMAPGTAMITPEKQQLIGVKTGLVERRVLEKTIRAVGRVEYDETKLSYVNTKIEGWIEKLYVDYTGKPIKKGEPLLSIYSPDLVSTQEEYLLALETREKVRESRYEDVKQGAESLVATTRKRLEYWDIPQEEIKKLEETKSASKTLTLYSPIDGFVVEKDVLLGKKIMPGENLYKIADISKIWVLADIYEYELPFISLGQEAKISLSYLPGEEFTGTVTYIYPYIEAMTRTVKVRLEFDNPDFKLKPDMYANVEIKSSLGEKVAVPEEAILDTGERQIAFVDKGEGHFEPREVKLGAKAAGFYEVLSGLKEGERVVTSANFLIDSESKMKAALGGMGGEHKHAQ